MIAEPTFNILFFLSYPRKAYMQQSNSRQLMPTFYDMTGFEDEEGVLQAEMLSIFFNGKLQERDNLKSVRQYYSENRRDIHRLRQLYNKRSVKARVDRIIVVCAANPTRPLPVSLLTAIRETASRGSRGNVNSKV
jgi:arylsulfatase A-like enzyme